MPDQWRTRLKLIGLALVFVGPVVAAWVLLMIGWRPAGQVNYGSLVEPPVPVQAAGLTLNGEPVSERFFRGRWTMLISIGAACGEECLQVLDQTGRVHVALNQNMDRVRRVLVLAEGQRPPEELHAFEFVNAPVSTLREWNGHDPVSIQLVDPDGLRMMSYGYPLEARGLLKDFERLLRLSRRAVERYRAMLDEQ